MQRGQRIAGTPKMMAQMVAPYGENVLEARFAVLTIDIQEQISSWFFFHNLTLGTKKSPCFLQGPQCAILPLGYIKTSLKYSKEKEHETNFLSKERGDHWFIFCIGKRLTIDIGWWPLPRSIGRAYSTVIIPLPFPKRRRRQGAGKVILLHHQRGQQ